MTDSFIILLTHVVTVLEVDQGRSGWFCFYYLLLYEQKMMMMMMTVYSKECDFSRSYSTSLGQDKLEKHCSKDGLLNREDIVIVARALSQVNQVSLCTVHLTDSGDCMIGLRVRKVPAKNSRKFIPIFRKFPEIY